MRYLILIQILFFSHLPTTAWSQTHCSNQNVIQIFQSSFNDHSVYNKGSCPTNIWNFLKVLESCQISVKDMNVIYITEDNLNVYLNHGRGGANQWFFHVILSWRGLIFDFDYTNQPNVTTNDDYFQKALSSQAKSNWEGLQLRLIPAHEYLVKYDVDNTAQFGFYYWLLPEKSSYPQLSIPELIK